MSGLGTPALGFLKTRPPASRPSMTIFVLSFLMVLQGPKLVEGTLALFPEDRAEHIRAVGTDCAKTITGYISGNLLISVICGVLTYVVLKIVGVPFAGLIALFVGHRRPDPARRGDPRRGRGGARRLRHSVPAGIVVIVFFVLYQQLENHLLQPLIFARTVKLNPLTVLIAILIAVELAGILGALLAIPIAGMIQIVVRDVWERHRGLAQTRTARRGRRRTGLTGTQRRRSAPTRLGASPAARLAARGRGGCGPGTPATMTVASPARPPPLTPGILPDWLTNPADLG